MISLKIDTCDVWIPVCMYMKYIRIYNNISVSKYWLEMEYVAVRMVNAGTETSTTKLGINLIFLMT